jgi:hypothetical protein
MNLSETSAESESALAAPIRAGDGRTGPTRSQLRGDSWQRSSYGLFVPRSAPATTRQRIVEASARLPGYGAVGGWAAAYWQGVTYLNGQWAGEPTPVLLCLGDLGNIRPSAGVTVCRARMRPADVCEVDGLSVTTPVRTTFDGARMAPSLTEATVFVDMMLRSRLVTIAELSSYAALHRPAWKGVGQVRDAYRFADERSASPMETRLRMLWMLRAELPRPLVNAPVFNWREELVGIVDLLDPEAGTVGEYDGGQHRELAEHTADNVREEALEDLGLVVTRVTGPNMRVRDETAARLMRAWQRGESRDRSKDRWTLIQPEWYRQRALDYPNLRW